MCGLAGVFARNAAADELRGMASAMIAPIVHRGPDDSGVWVDADGGVALGFRRLAIIDLSEHGHQPMASPSGRFTMVFNGEIFNHGDMRSELVAAGYRFRGHSDTETALAAFEEWGIRRSVQRFVGMFSIAVWDTHERSLTLLRDRLGIKPMFVSWQPDRVLFGSELKSLMVDGSFDRTLDPAAVQSFLRYLYVPAPASIFRGTAKLLPGHLLTLRATDDRLPESNPYWTVDETARQGLSAQFRGSPDQAVDELERILFDAVRLRLQADVPVGALLSGGIDSSTVVALAQKASTRPLKTYAVGFDVAEFNEAPAAAEVARHLGTDHTELMLSGDDALAVVPNLPELFDEPLADPSQIPTYLVCGLARRDVTVALSGDGGDEILAGYHRYIEGSRLIPRMQRVPFALRRTAGQAIRSVSSNRWDAVYRTVSPVLPRSARHRLPGQKIAKVARLAGSADENAMYRSLLSAEQNPAALMQNGVEASSAVERALERFADLPLLDRMMATDQATYLADDLLAKVDRASMAVSLEVRVPLLDHRVLGFAWTLPHDMKIHGGLGKWALRQILYRHVPRALVDRPKMGFTVPIAAWLRGPLRGWAEDLLEVGARRGDVLDHRAVRRVWNSFLAGDDSRATGMWAVLQLLAWREHWNV